MWSKVLILGDIVQKLFFTLRELKFCSPFINFGLNRLWNHSSRELARMYFKVHRSNIDQETIKHGYAICANGHALLRKAQNPIFASEGRRDFSDTGKCLQWPHLYMTYEATCGLKCLFQEILSKNCFLRSESRNFGCRLYIISLGGRTIGSQENWTMISI